jgi:glycosyltransferase involved in cell wall biosynthesis
MADHHDPAAGGRRGAPTFSVVIAAYDAERTLDATLRSLTAQTDGDFEAVVVDDGSSDGTSRVVEAFGDHRVRLLRQANAGPNAARNAGLAATSGNYVAILDADDLWYPTYLEAMRAALDGSPAAALAYTDAWLWDEGVGRFGRRTIMAAVAPPAPPPDDPRELLRELIARNFVYGSVAMRRASLEEVGGFDERLRRSEDWELWLRFAAHGYTFVLSAPVLAVYRVHASSQSASVGLMRQAERATLEKMLMSYGLDDELAAEVRTRIASIDLRPPIDESRTPGGRQRLTHHLPSALRIRSYRLRRPRDVPPELEALLWNSRR